MINPSDLKPGDFALLRDGSKMKVSADSLILGYPLSDWIPDGMFWDQSGKHPWDIVGVEKAKALTTYYALYWTPNVEISLDCVKDLHPDADAIFRLTVTEQDGKPVMTAERVE